MADRPALDAFWLPALGGRRVETEERPFGPGRVPLRVAALTPETLRELLTGLRANAGRVLADRPVADLLNAIDAATRLLTRPGEPLHAELVETLPGLTGYSRRMIEIGLERMAAGWTADALRGALEGELGRIDVLDDYQPRGSGGLHRAYGPSLTVHIFSGNIPGVSVSSLIRAFCVKSASFGKTAAGEPYFAVCFARALAQLDADLASCLAVSYWPGGSEDLEAVAFSEAEAVIVYGSDEAVADVRRRLPGDARLLAYPNRVGAALIAKSGLDRSGLAELARRAARDVAIFDQRGCVSPHVIFVERGGDVGAERFGEELARGLDRLSDEIPRGAIAPAESSLIHQVRAQAEVRGATVLASEAGTEWTVIVESREGFEPSPLHRVVLVRPVDDVRDAVSALERVGRRLQTVAIAAEPAALKPLASRLGAIGATRVVRVGDAAWPAPHWHHDGRFQFLDLVRFVDLEA